MPKMPLYCNKMIATHKMPINTELSNKKMLITGKSVISFYSNGNIYSFRQNGRRHVTMVTANKRDTASENSSSPKQRPKFPLKISSKLLAQSAVAVLGLGFIDAGYSGDWSRIGVISKESEEWLKIAAFLVAPICLFFIISLSNRSEELNS